MGNRPQGGATTRLANETTPLVCGWLFTHGESGAADVPHGPEPAPKHDG
jgi:hypothetical protein